MRLLVQPGEGVAPLIKAIDGAKNTVELLIFRFDRKEIEKALVNAAKRGVFVHTLIASTNRGGENALRQLETRLLAAGVTVARTADDLVRYHGKYMIVDRRELFLMSFNMTYADIERSRSFALILKNPKLMQEAVRLFEADTKRQPYEPAQPGFLVSPVNARKELASFIAGAKKELSIYDPKISDPAMIRLLAERAKAGVNIRVIGRMTRRVPEIPVYKLSRMRLHTRTIIRDRKTAFIGSQSLRKLELDARREVGVIFRDLRACATLEKVFEEDWNACSKFGDAADCKVPAVKVAKKVAKAVTKELPPMAPVVEGAVKEVVGQNAGIEINAEELEQTVKDAVKHAVKLAVRDAVQEVVGEKAGEGEPCLVGGAAGK